MLTRTTLKVVAILGAAVLSVTGLGAFLQSKRLSDRRPAYESLWSFQGFHVRPELRLRLEFIAAADACVAVRSNLPHSNALTSRDIAQMSGFAELSKEAPLYALARVTELQRCGSVLGSSELKTLRAAAIGELQTTVTTPAALRAAWSGIQAADLAGLELLAGEMPARCPDFETFPAAQKSSWSEMTARCSSTTQQSATPCDVTSLKRARAQNLVNCRWAFRTERSETLAAYSRLPTSLRNKQSDMEARQHALTFIVPPTRLQDVTLLGSSTTSLFVQFTRVASGQTRTDRPLARFVRRLRVGRQGRDGAYDELLKCVVECDSSKLRSKIGVVNGLAKQHDPVLFAMTMLFLQASGKATSCSEIPQKFLSSPYLFGICKAGFNAASTSTISIAEWIIVSSQTERKARCSQAMNTLKQREFRMGSDLYFADLQTTSPLDHVSMPSTLAGVIVYEVCK
jgi:hypothetical protein